MEARKTTTTYVPWHTCAHSGTARSCLASHNPHLFRKWRPSPHQNRPYSKHQTLVTGLNTTFPSWRRPHTPPARTDNLNRRLHFRNPRFAVYRAGPPRAPHFVHPTGARRNGGLQRGRGADTYTTASMTDCISICWVVYKRRGGDSLHRMYSLPNNFGHFKFLPLHPPTSDWRPPEVLEYSNSMFACLGLQVPHIEELLLET